MNEVHYLNLENTTLMGKIHQSWGAQKKTGYHDDRNEMAAKSRDSGAHIGCEQVKWIKRWRGTFWSGPDPLLGNASRPYFAMGARPAV